MGHACKLTVAFGLGLALAQARAAGPPLKLVMLSGSGEYKSGDSLPPFAKHLEANYNVKATVLQAKGDTELPGTEAIDGCDVLLIFTRRLKLEGESLERIKKHCLGGKPVVALRTASHAIQTWLDLDREVLGGSYKGHGPGNVIQKVTVAPEAKGHPVLKGVADFESPYSLYKTSPIAKDATLLLTGATERPAASEPAAWVRECKGGRVFYASLGGIKDFDVPAFRQLLINAVFWVAKREAEAKP